MKYYTREGALDEIRQRCPHKFRFEYAFAQSSMLIIRDLMGCIDNNTPTGRFLYTEQLDFLDGNGFSVEKINDNWYILTYVYEEESQ